MDGGERKCRVDWPSVSFQRALPDGNLILMGGQNNHEAYLNDVCGHR